MAADRSSAARGEPCKQPKTCKNERSAACAGNHDHGILLQRSKPPGLLCCPSWAFPSLTLAASSGAAIFLAKDNRGPGVTASWVDRLQLPRLMCDMGTKDGRCEI